MLAESCIYVIFHSKFIQHNKLKLVLISNTNDFELNLNNYSSSIGTSRI